MKELNSQNLWNFKLGGRESMNLPIYVISGFQQRYRLDSQKMRNYKFCTLPVTSSQCVFRTGNYPDADILSNYDDDDYSQGYGQIKEGFRALTKDDLLQPYTSPDTFRSSITTADDVGENICNSEMRWQQIFTAAQPVKLELKIDGALLNHVNGYVLVSTDKLVSVSGDLQRHFDLI